MTDLPSPSPQQAKARLAEAMCDVLTQLPHFDHFQPQLTFSVTHQEMSQGTSHDDVRDHGRAQVKRDTQSPSKIKSMRREVVIPLKDLAKLSQPQLKTLIAHELIHCCFQHRERGHTHEPSLWGLAADHEANAILQRAGFELSPNACLWQERVESSAEAVYEELRQQHTQKKAQQAQQQAQQQDQQHPQHQTSTRSGHGRHLSSQNAYRALERMMCAGGRPPLETPKHQWSRERPPLARSRDVIACLSFSEARGLVAQRKHVQHQAQDSELNSGLNSELNSELEAQLNALHNIWGESRGAHKLSPARHEAQSATPWALILRDFIKQRAHRYHTRRFRRRELGRGLYLPSMRGDAIRFTIALDTSGSTIALLPRFMSEVEQILRACPRFELTLIQCACQLQAVDHLTQHDLSRLSNIELIGGGGTAFKPVFDYIAASPERPPHLLIYITDGIGKTVETAPPFPVIWVLASDSKHTLPHELDPPASFGLALPLHIAS